MVGRWFKRALAPRVADDPLWRAVQDEVESIGRAAEIARVEAERARRRT